MLKVLSTEKQFNYTVKNILSHHLTNYSSFSTTLVIITVCLHSSNYSFSPLSIYKKKLNFNTDLNQGLVFALWVILMNLIYLDT